MVPILDSAGLEAQQCRPALRLQNMNGGEVIATWGEVEMLLAKMRSTRGVGVNMHVSHRRYRLGRIRSQGALTEDTEQYREDDLAMGLMHGIVLDSWFDLPKRDPIRS